MAEMEEQAKKLHNPPNMYGFVARGLKNANATPWAYVIYAMGGELLDARTASPPSGRPEWVKAMDWYAGMLKRFAPPGVVNFNWYECSSAFMQGQVGIYYDGVNFANQFEDPAEVQDRREGRRMRSCPRGPRARFTPTFTNAMAVSAQSRNKEAAYLFIQWSTNKQNCIRELLAGVGVGRASTWSDPEVKAKPKMPADWYDAYLDSLKIGQGRPARDRGRDPVPGHHRRGHPEGHRRRQARRSSSPRPTRSSRNCWTRPRSRRPTEARRTEDAWSSRAAGGPGVSCRAEVG